MLVLFDMRTAVGGDLDARETFLMLLDPNATDDPIESVLLMGRI